MSKTIFLVDDSATILMSVSATLLANGFKVETASDGLQALEKLNAGLKPDLMITDINMPNMGGLELIQNVRTLPDFRSMPILTLTSESHADKRAEGEKMGANGWLVKPIADAELLRVIEQVLPRT
ncbi:Response regulator MprA [Polaromonas vacuolata]|uniref:Response regulator MprA n=1 Tax=Polaromonas vacuolata TaxID=37448 RepID=A0A6H2H8P6_9BURK|nr:response regulator [Polaromonas vacuolata]QJC56200.1 Response regulator MprA [Polaromonas vacuolata]